MHYFSPKVNVERFGDYHNVRVLFQPPLSPNIPLNLRRLKFQTQCLVYMNNIRVKYLESGENTGRQATQLPPP